MGLKRQTQADFERAWHALRKDSRTQSIAVDASAGDGSVGRSNSAIQNSAQGRSDEAARRIEIRFVRYVI